jgi:hypothetical protein
MTLINSVKEVKKTQLDEQRFFGKVVDNADPKKLGRVKIRVLELFDSEDRIPTSKLPWAVKEDNQFLGKNSKQFCVPSIGTYVSLYFSKGDIYSPIYCGELQSQDNYDVEQEDDYGDVILKKDRNGNKIKNNLATNEIGLTYNGKVIINISDLIQLNGEDDLEINISGKSTENVAGDKQITALKLIVTAANSEFSGNVKILGNLEVIGTSTLAGATTIETKPFLGHTHSGVTPGPGTTGPVS